MASDSTWQNHVDSVQRGSVSANVNARRYGEAEVPSRSELEEASDDSSGLESAHEPTDWQAKFSHLPGVSPDE